MKNLLIFFGIVVLGMVSFQGTAYSQSNAHHASVNKVNGLITINPGAPVQSSYTFDVSDLALTSQATASAYFAHYNSKEYLNISVNLQTKIATLNLNYAPIADSHSHFRKFSIEN